MEVFTVPVSVAKRSQLHHDHMSPTPSLDFGQGMEAICCSFSWQHVYGIYGLALLQEVWFYHCYYTG
jgi:hypothetical protein